MIAERCLGTEQSEIRKIFNMATENSINLGIGEPDFDTPKNIVEAAKLALDAGKTHYVPNAGILELTSAISEKLKKDNNLDISQKNIVTTCGASEALMLSLFTLVNRGEEVLVPDPGFVSYKGLTELCEGKMVPIDLDDKFRIDLESVKKQYN